MWRERRRESKLEGKDGGAGIGFEGEQWVMQNQTAGFENGHAPAYEVHQG